MFCNLISSLLKHHLDAGPNCWLYHRCRATTSWILVSLLSCRSTKRKTSVALDLICLSCLSKHCFTDARNLIMRRAILLAETQTIEHGTIESISVSVCIVRSFMCHSLISVWTGIINIETMAALRPFSAVACPLYLILSKPDWASCCVLSLLSLLSCYFTEEQPHLAFFSQ